jgi:hypothetical protein
VVGAVLVGTMGLPICQGTKKDGKPCQFRGRWDGWCKFHAPKDCPDCPICYEAVTAKDHIKTICNHEFHRSCLQKWTKDHTTCPLCRALVVPKPPKKPLTVRMRPFSFVEGGRTYHFSGSVFEVADY